MKAIGKLVFFSFIAMVLLFTASDLFADVVGKISFVTGRVDILQKDQESAVPVEVGAPVSLGDIVRTKSNARAEITFLDETIVRIAQSTRLEITNYLFDEKGARKGGVLSLFRGKIRAMVSRPFKITPASLAETPDLEIHTPNAVAGVRGTDFYAIFEKGFSWFLVNSGLLSSFSKDNPDEAIFIKKKNCVKIGSGKTRRKLQGSCIYNPIDADRHSEDTDPIKTAAASSDEGEELFGYSPPSSPGVPGIDDPPLPLVGGASTPPVDLGDPFSPICDTCNPDIPLIPTTTGKSGDFERIYPPVIPNPG
jgi:hypothetical protein